MALTEIEYGALASSEVMNNNFNYLDNRINNVSATILSNSAGLSSNIASISSTLSAFTEEVNTDIDNINDDLDKAFACFAENGIYITTYVNGTSWYREFFTNAEKTQRIWLEQGGSCAPGATISFLKEFSDTNYIVSRGLYSSYGGDGDAAFCPFVYIPSKTVSGFKFNECSRNAFGRYSIYWRACGK